MGLYNFQARFVPFILSGEKTHAIRAIRANPDKAGHILHLYTGLRTKGARLLGRWPCVKVEDIRIWLETGEDKEPIFAVAVDGEELSHTEKEALARRDGFGDFTEMAAFWEQRLPFEGHIIHWRKW